MEADEGEAKGTESFRKEGTDVYHSALCVFALKNPWHMIFGMLVALTSVSYTPGHWGHSKLVGNRVLGKLLKLPSGGRTA